MAFLSALPMSAWNIGQDDWGSITQPSPITPSITSAPTTSGLFGIQGLGANLDTARLGLGGLQALGGIWSAAQQNKLAKKAFNFQKGILDTNLANQIKAYNLGLDDKFRSRAVVEGRSPEQTAADINKWAATDQRRGY